MSPARDSSSIPQGFHRGAPKLRGCLFSAFFRRAAQLPVLNMKDFENSPVKFDVIAGLVPVLIGSPLLKSAMVVFVPATVAVYSVFGSSG